MAKNSFIMVGPSTSPTPPQQQQSTPSPIASKLRYLSPRAPLLYLLLPLVSSILFAQWVGFSVGIIFWLCIGIFFGGVGVLFFFAVRKKEERFLKIVVHAPLQLCLFFCLTAYVLWLMPPEIKWKEAPVREVVVQMEIGRLFQNDAGAARQSGLGTITEAPKHLQELVGQSIYFVLQKPLVKPSSEEDASLNAIEGLKEDYSSLIQKQQWTVRGVLEQLQLEDAGFDRYLGQNHVHYRLSRGTFVELKHNAGYWRQFCERGKERLTQILCAGSSLDNANTAIYVAMLLGQQSALDAEQKELFTLSGTIHLFAISGLHIAVIAAVLFGIFRLMRMPNTWSALLGLVILWMYVDITGAAPSAVRAFMMIALIWGAHAVLRKPSSFSTLVASACVSLLMHPLDLFNVGFQLSYAVVASILLYGVPLVHVLKSRWTPYAFIPEDSLTAMQKGVRYVGLRLIEGGAINFGAFLVSTPITMEYFQLMTPGSLLTNLLLVPLSSVVISVGLFAMAFGIIGITFIAVLLNAVAKGFIFVMNVIVEASMHIPGVYFKMETLGTTSTFLVLIAMLVIFYRFTNRDTPEVQQSNNEMGNDIDLLKHPQRVFLYAPCIGLLWMGLCFAAKGVL